MRNQYNSNRHASVAAQISGQVVKTNVHGTRVGPVAQAAAVSGTSTISVTLDNSATATKTTFLLAAAVYKAISGLTLSKATGNDVDIDTLEDNLGKNPVAISEIHIQANVNESQHKNAMRLVEADISGNTKTRKLDIGKFASAADQNSKIRVIQLKGEDMAILSDSQGLQLDVNANETVDLILTVNLKRA